MSTGEHWPQSILRFARLYLCGMTVSVDDSQFFLIVDKRCLDSCRFDFYDLAADSAAMLFGDMNRSVIVSVPSIATVRSRLCLLSRDGWTQAPALKSRIFHKRAISVRIQDRPGLCVGVEHDLDFRDIRK